MTADARAAQALRDAAARERSAFNLRYTRPGVGDGAIVSRLIREHPEMVLHAIRELRAGR